MLPLIYLALGTALSPIASKESLLLLLLLIVQGPEFAYWWARIDDCMGKWQQLQQVRIAYPLKKKKQQQLVAAAYALAVAAAAAVHR
jgi:hypothetical protein